MKALEMSRYDKKEKNTARPRGTDSALIVEVIMTQSLMGEGTESDPCRLVTQYWHKNGKLIATIDTAT